MTKAELVRAWVDDRQQRPEEIVDLLLKTKAEQLTILRAFAAARKAEIDAVVANYDSTAAAHKATVQAEGATLVGII